MLLTRSIASLTLMLVVAVAVLSGAESAKNSSQPAAASTEVRGMTISCHGWGREWGSDAMVEAMRECKELGVNWIAIHPYAGIRGNGEVVMSQRAYSDTRWMSRPIEEAHKLGLKILIKPHIAYWGSPFSWRGEITFDTKEEWDRFFDTYTTWITSVVEICKNADAFAVGTELDKTTRYDERWRAIIRSVRERTDAPLTFASNWDQYTHVPFWDALDAIGIQSYFPLVRHEQMPTQDELRDSWQTLLNDLESFAEKHNRSIVLAELGYNMSSRAAVEPWGYRQGGEQAEEVQRRCLHAALDALKGRDRVVGAFLWKWFPGRSRRENFLKSTPVMQTTIRRHWADQADDSQSEPTSSQN